MRNKFILTNDDEYPNEYDLYITTDTFTDTTDHTIWRYNDHDDVWVMSTDPDKYYSFQLNLDFSIYKKSDSRDIIEGSKFELIKILENAVRNYSKIFSDKRNYDFNVVENIWNEERSLQMKNLIVHL